MTAEFNFFELADEHASVRAGAAQKKEIRSACRRSSRRRNRAGRLAAQLATNITVSEEGDTTYHAYSMYQYARTWRLDRVHGRP